MSLTSLMVYVNAYEAKASAFSSPVRSRIASMRR